MSAAALLLIGLYQRFLSPVLPPACRFWPTCSHYAASAIARHGFWRGCLLAARRLLKCHPFHPGGYDPVPPVGGAGPSVGRAGPTAPTPQEHW
ncbi:MAG: membrane protein insertion efficiency factor YidD [Candidatus Adiutrix sp.]|nr:membrane protein insertion efficiency factor YidD [Candidatus Adiutrix sp.]